MSHAPNSAGSRSSSRRTPQWSTLQRAVTLSMKHPELAKRLMPVVLPWLNRAA